MINIQVNNLSLIKDALTHKSERQEQLEFIGDAVLGLVISKMLCQTHPEFGEGNLTIARSNLVNKKYLCNKFREIGLNKFLDLQTGVEETERIMGDAFEALIGAIFIDKGFEVISDLINKWFKLDIIDASILLERDYKTELQEYLQKKGLSLPQYISIEKEKLFHTSIFINNKMISTGKGLTKKAAEQEAASQALYIIKETTY